MHTRMIDGHTYDWNASLGHWALAAAIPRAGHTQYRIIAGRWYQWNAGINEWVPVIMRGGARMVRGVPTTVGATNPHFTPPSGFSDANASPALLTALNNLLTGYAATGVPSEHVADPLALALQTAWDNDPSIAAVGGNALLDKDGGYGPNTALAVATINGGSAPTVNTSSAPATPTNPGTNTTTTTTTTTTTSSSTGWIIGGALLAAALIVGGTVWYKKGGKAHIARHRARRAMRRMYRTHHHALRA